MKICMIISTPFPPEEGIGYYTENLSKKLIKKGYEVTVITRGSLKTNREILNGIQIIRCPFVPLYPFHIYIHGFFVNRLLRKIGNDFDIIHIHTPLSSNIVCSVPIVSTVHTSVIEDANHIRTVDLKSFCTKILTKYISYPLVAGTIRQSKVVMTVARSVAQELEDYYGYNGTIVVGNGVDEKMFSPLHKRDNKPYILFIGRLSYRKGLFDLLACAKEICNRYDISFKIVGKGELEGKIREQIEKEHLQKHVHLLGHQSRVELIKLYENATIFVLPSHYEGLPTVLLEAMACGLPVVAANVSGCPDVILDGVNGFLIPPKSPKLMIRAISNLLDDEELRNEFGRNARKTIEEHNTWDLIAGKIEDCYREVL